MFAIDKSIVILFGMCIGLVSIYLGYKLFIKGIEGSSSLVGEFKITKLSLRNASPGLFFVLFGAFIILTGVFKEEIHYKLIYEEGKPVSVEYTSKGVAENGLSNSDNLFNVAVKLKSKGDVNDSKIAYEAILIMDSTYDKAYNNLSLICMELAEYPKSLELIDKAIKFGTKSAFLPNYYHTKSKIYSKMGDKENAKKFLNNAITLDPYNESFKEFMKTIVSDEK